jgi:NAD(P)-dependent dehydrogenase (short-subunit alcohol dehydrogenase family)
MVIGETQYSPAKLADLGGKTALVTGATRGIGKAIALALASAGAKVIISGRDEKNARAVVSDIAKSGGTAGYIVADLFDDDAVGSLIATVVAQFGTLDILVNNAGIDADAPAIDYDLEKWRRVLRFNLEVPFRLCQQAAQHFVQHRGGSIINITSVLGHVAVPEGCSYVAAKHGLIGLTKTLAIEWGRHGVRVNAIAPGLIQTDMTSYTWNSAAGAAYVEHRIPVGRIGQPRDIGGAVVFLASDAADFIHGETIAIDGGFLAT